MIYYVRVQVYAVPINCDPFAKGSKGLNSDSDSVCDCGTEVASLACHSRQQLSQLIGFRFISSIFLVASYSSHIQMYVVIYCAKNSKKMKLTHRYRVQ